MEMHLNWKTASPCVCLHPCLWWARRENVTEQRTDPGLSRRILEIEEVNDEVEPVLPESFTSHKSSRSTGPLEDQGAFAHERRRRKAGEAGTDDHEFPGKRHFESVAKIEVRSKTLSLGPDGQIR
jgi:hypothetical protein